LERNVHGWSLTPLLSELKQDNDYSAVSKIGRIPALQAGAEDNSSCVTNQLALTTLGEAHVQNSY
jgi:hypothetical protein